MHALTAKAAKKNWLNLSKIGLILLIAGYANSPKPRPKARCICLASWLLNTRFSFVISLK